MKDFIQLPHTADIKIRVFGKTKKELFANALIGMFQVIKPIIEGCEYKDDRVICETLPITHEIDVESPDEVALMVDFLSDALYLSDVYNEAYLAAEIHELSDTHIRATIYGTKVNGFEVVEIKAVTYHELEIKNVGGMWQAEIVFDI